VSWLRRSLDAKADREQLFTNAVHLIRFPTEVIVNRWVAERSGNLLKESLEHACSVWREAKNGKLPSAPGASIGEFTGYIVGLGGRKLLAGSGVGKAHRIYSRYLLELCDESRT